MKVYVYYDSDINSTYCFLYEQTAPLNPLVQIIECEETLAPITSFIDPKLIAIGEVFRCNDSNANLIRTA